MVNVVYDLSNCGWSLWDERHRMGIYTATTQLAMALARLKQDGGFSGGLHWYSTRSVAQGTQAFCQSQPALAPYPVVVNRHRLGRFVQQHPVPKSPRQSFSRWQQAQWWLETRYAQQLDAQLDQPDTLFHSSIYPMPQPRRMRRCLTLHDLLFIDHPHTCTAPTRYQLMQTMRLLRPQDGVIAVSQFVKDRLCQKFGTDPDRVWVVPLAPKACFTDGQPADELLWQQLSQQYGLSHQSFILTACTVEPRKNLVTLLKAFDRLCQQPGYDGLKLVVAGPIGWKAESAQALVARSERLQQQVVWLGFQDDAALKALYAHAKLFAFPSYYEGFGLPLVEAAAMGLPVVCANATAVPEVMGEAGVQLDPYNETLWAEALEELLTDSAAWVRQSNLSRQVAASYSWEQTARQALLAYEAMLN